MTSACADATAAATADALSVSTESVPTQPGVVFRSTQRLYCAAAKEELVLYRTGQFLLKKRSSPDAFEGTYEITDEGKKVVLYFSEQTVYCDVSIRNGSIVRLECNGGVYYPQN